MKYEILDDQIVYFPEALDNLQEIIDLIENTSGNAVSPWKEWYANADTHAYGNTKTLRRKLLEEDLDAEVREKSERLINSLTDHMTKCFIEYAKIYSLEEDDLNNAISILNYHETKFSINKYIENRHMGPHIDLNDVNNDIKFVIAIYFNDDHEGGELNFVNHNVTIKPKAGSIMMFPADLPYLHESLEITKGRKMIMTHHWKIKQHTLDNII
jgi:hypothetical protein